MEEDVKDIYCKKPGEAMGLALKEAQAAAKAGEVPVGAVIIDSQTGKVLARAHNRVERDNDPTAHAEVLAIRSLSKQQKNARLKDCDLYVTLEPCPMCATAISFARIRRVYYGAYDPKGGGVDHGPCIYEHDTCHHRPEVYGGLSEEACAALLKSFFQERR
ncbi:nucleoside deaminase [Kiloniella antarctica]|uniref:tRNA-specific adenosine deaminase n=1 Tax=Kiloniella antarctica TaxID=1550907 RepID=A0ABW5BFP8_9PROT